MSSAWSISIHFSVQQYSLHWLVKISRPFYTYNVWPNGLYGTLSVFHSFNILYHRTFRFTPALVGYHGIWFWSFSFVCGFCWAHFSFRYACVYVSVAFRFQSTWYTIIASELAFIFFIMCTYLSRFDVTSFITDFLFSTVRPHIDKSW